MLSGVNLLRRLSQFVPKHLPPETEDIKNFQTFLSTYSNILILTGAGVSTESGIPDYRSEDVGVFARSSYKPMQYSDFVKSPGARTRYWARNFVGWPKFKSFKPNVAHKYITGLQCITGKTINIVTQNVDGLHSKAGSSNIIELHGNAFWVSCLQCRDVISRFDFQNTLESINPFMKETVNEIRPDGDVEISDEVIKNFKVPDCEKCGGILKPMVVFFGESIPESRVKAVEKLVTECQAILILGTSLSTLSSYRIVEQGFDLCKFLCLVNIGPTRADNMMDLKISAKISDVISKVN